MSYFVIPVTATAGLPYSDLYEPVEFGSAGGGVRGGRGGGRIWFNVTNTIHIDGVVSANGVDGSLAVNTTAGGGGSGGSIWMHCYRMTGYGQIHAKGGKGSDVEDAEDVHGAGGGAGGRLAVYFYVNHTFTAFRYLASGGPGSSGCTECEAGGPGTVFLYHMQQEHRTLLIDNDGMPTPHTKYVNWDNLTADGGRAWILPLSGLHNMAEASHRFHFEELQVYGGGHLAVHPLTQFYDGSEYIIQDQLFSEMFKSTQPYNVTLHFRYMIGDRTGSVHVADGQEMDLEREEIDLPFSAYVYRGGHLGLAPETIVHGVEIHLSGVLSHIQNLTLHHGGYLWLKHGGRTTDEPDSMYVFKNVRIQDDSSVNATTDPVDEPGITFHTQALYVEGGGTLHGTRLTMVSENITVDDGGRIMADGLGYHHLHRQDTHWQFSLHGDVNPGVPDDVTGVGSGGGHGGSGGRGSHSEGHSAGPPYGDLYEPYMFGSSGGPGVGREAGGTGGGIIWMNVTGFILIDGEVSANGGYADSSGGGGGSGGSIWMYCNLIRGYGQITANGGPGSTNMTSPGGGGAGGRIALYFWENETMTGFTYRAMGGHAGDIASSENGGAGTVFLYHMVHQHRTLLVDNGGLQPKDRFHVIESYSNLSTDGCRTWILPVSGSHAFASELHVYDYQFEEFQMYGSAHMAILTEPTNANTSLFFLYMIGDRSGTVHLGQNQVMDLERERIDLPFSVRAYSGSYLGLAPITVVHNVSVWMHGELDHVEFLTLHHNGMMSLEHGGHTTDEELNHYEFVWVRIQDNSTLAGITDPVTESGIMFYVDDLFIEGGGTFMGTSFVINAVNITIDDGGSMHADGLGYRPLDDQDAEAGINLGMGVTGSGGSSGAGHGGSSGHGAGTSLTGQPYGHLFEPKALGSAGGGGPGVGGRGGGTIWFNVTNQIQIDGELRADGEAALGPSGGGGSGGSLWLHCQIFTGTGNITANGGNQHSPGGSGGGGAAGRIAMYFWENQTYYGTYQAHGGDAVGDNGEPGGPGTVFLYHEHHKHSTLYINNNQRLSAAVSQVRNYMNLSTDSFKAWFLPESGDHWLAQSNHDYYFDELQIYGNAHLALLPHPFTEGATLYFKHMIGDRSGSIHIGPHQVMDLHRPFLDTPFNSYVYANGYLGLAPDTEIQKVFVHVEGTLDHIVNLTVVHGGELRLFQTGSTNRLPRLHYVINGTTVVKAQSAINASAPFAHPDQFQLKFGELVVEGGGRVSGKNLRIEASTLTVDDGGHLEVNDGGHLADLGPGKE